MSIRVGIAVGGPLNCAKITSGAAWNGRTAQDDSGYYRWSEIHSRWEWQPLPMQMKVLTRPARIKR